MDARQRSTNCWLSLQSRLRSRYIRMMGEESQVGTDEFRRTGREVGLLGDLITKRLTSLGH